MSRIPDTLPENLTHSFVMLLIQRWRELYEATALLEDNGNIENAVCHMGNELDRVAHLLDVAIQRLCKEPS